MDLRTDILPVLRHYLGQMDRILSVKGVNKALGYRLSAEALSAGEHFRTAQGFALRLLLPPLGQKIPELGTQAVDLAALQQRSLEIGHILAHLAHEDLTQLQPVSHKAGFAELTQSPFDYVMLFALPNFMFHLSTGHASLRAAGVPLGKAEFDGQHNYPQGFSWVSSQI